MILITRPKIEAQQFANELHKKNFVSVIDSILKFEPQKKKIYFSQDKIFLVTSSQCVKSLNKYRKSYSHILKEGIFYVVGRQVYKNLKSIGVKKIKFVFGDTQELLRKLRLLNKKKALARYEYLCGSKINDDFLEQCRLNKISIKKNILYKTIAVSTLKQTTLKSIKGGEIKILTFFSIFTAKTFFKLMRKYNLTEYIVDHDVYIMCLSKRISNYVLFNEGNISKKRLKWAPKPEQNELIKCIQKLKVIKKTD
tara:strand:- start:125 stop:883 length:759 start_codon:yes stop_codon:yes gene_type:complete